MVWESSEALANASAIFCLALEWLVRSVAMPYSGFAGVRVDFTMR
jgi:hypothetical protein